MSKLFWFMLAFLFCGCEPPNVSHQTIAVTFDRTQLSIPRKYFLPGLPPTLVPSQDMDEDVGVSLEIPLQDLGYKVGNGISFYYNLMVSMTPLRIVHPPNRLPPSALWAWKGTGLYKNGLLEFDEMIQLYRIYDDAEYRVSWQLFKSSPNQLKLPEEEWVARCSSGLPGKETPKLSNATCDTVFLYKDIYVEMTLSGMYINLIEEFQDKIEKLFESWESHKPSVQPNTRRMQ